jgi:hypothetical protein
MGKYKEPLSREDILRQAAEDFNVDPEDLDREAALRYAEAAARERARNKAYQDRMRREAATRERMAREARARERTREEARRVASRCPYCGRQFEALVYRDGHLGFCEKNPANDPHVYKPRGVDPNLAKCMFCGQMVQPEVIARHQKRCPQRPNARQRYRDGVKTTSTLFDEFIESAAEAKEAFETMADWLKDDPTAGGTVHGPYKDGKL